MTLAVYFVVTPNVLLLDYAGPAETLRMAADIGADLTITTCAPVPELHTSMGITLSGLSPLPAQLPDGALVIVAGNASEELDYARPEALAVIDWLAAQRGRDIRVASICSGALLLARAGWLDARPCTTHHALLDMLRQSAPSARVMEDRVFVDDGQVVTSAGITTGIDLALYVIEQHFGAELAARVARRLVMYARRGPNDPQLSPWLAHRNHLHPVVHKVQDAITRDPARRWTLEELAELAHVGPRHLTRLFTRHAGIGVVAYQQQLRIARARQLLADPALSMERVAEQCGFASARDFRRVWAMYVDDSPRAHRTSH
ncbi:helix-turn-helix domain-containing protein [Zoogloeaceae bacterium G21618-S1]|uniref:Helix-turn-helix domain-containing protein n=1 Tax=Denitromonas halophila TaxID=1629404 RepID=A0A557R174_9RHOO|nr:helix-turn-helix domain-containing protein [Denitromonas halophila]MCZ4303986.1 helix-turn-helix domain-containing protein [Zoogloeaceae bacterium G21618-S1]TVO58911.1 helix-turn-helix domain-containing protein [Denitromonas halophila]